jgi:hypothetical protein
MSVKPLQQNEMSAICTAFMAFTSLTVGEQEETTERAEQKFRLSCFANSKDTLFTRRSWRNGNNKHFGI